MSGDRHAFLTQTLGPGLLFAGAAVGVSHLVQSTRAGAVFGLALALVIIAANILKYPAFSFGPQYAAATGTSLLEGYRRRGLWALVLYAVVTVGTMFVVQAVVTLVTAALAKTLFGLSASVPTISAVLVTACAALLAVGDYRWLDRVIKFVVAALTVLTIVATILALPQIDWGGVALWPRSDQLTLDTALFVAALVGWMPSAIDVAVWHSLWTLAKRRDTQHAPTVRESLLDFQIGYLGSAGLALCFMLLGAAVMSGQQPSPSAAVFAGQVIEMYTQTLGEWSRYLIGACAFGVMFSTTLTVVDGFPRALSALAARFRGPEPADAAEPVAQPIYWAAVLLLGLGSVWLIDYALGGGKDFKRIVDLATALAFVTAPALAFLNHQAVFGDEVPDDARPGPRMRLYSQICIGLLAAFALAWLYARFLA